MTHPRIRWTSPALDRLETIGSYIARHDPKAALAVVARIMSAAERLADLPGMGRPGRVSGTRELVMTDIPYIVAYRASPEAIDILAVMHTSQRWPDRF